MPVLQADIASSADVINTIDASESAASYAGSLRWHAFAAITGAGANFSVSAIACERT